MEFKLITPKEAEFLKEIRFNKEEIIGELKNRLGKYEGIRYGKEQIREAKGDRATLNKFKEAIEGRRKEIKKRCLEPYERFEKEVKEVLGYIEKPIKAIDEQIKGYEERQKEEKKEAIESTHAIHITPYENLLPLSKIFKPKWLNTTYKLQDIVGEIKGIRERFEKDIEVIVSLKSEFEGQIKDKYIETLDLAAALGEKERLEEQKKKLEEVEGLRKPRTLTEGAIELQRPIKREEKIYEISFRVRGTEKQLNGLKTFLVGKGIEYERIGRDMFKEAEGA